MSGTDGPSRREFVLTSAAALLSIGAATPDAAPLSAQQAVERIQAAVGVPWRETTVDTFKAGDPRTAITGIATAVTPTLAALQQAVAAKLNFIIVAEPLFYSGNEEPGPRAADPVYLAKRTFIEKHGLVIWRFSDHWAARTPNEFVAALAGSLGWGRPGASAPGSAIYTIAPTTLGALAARVQETLATRGGMRMVGTHTLPIRRVLVSPGTTSLQTTVKYLPDADVILSGEPREWEAVEYVLDSAAAAQPRGMLAIGRLVSEEPGMRACATWLRRLLPEVPVQALAGGDPYWRPGA